MLLIVMLMVVACGLSDGNGDQKIVQASEILNNISNGKPIIYKDTIIKGNIDLASVNLPEKHIYLNAFERDTLKLSNRVKTINSSINLINCTIMGNLLLHNAIFKKSIFFNSVRFMGYVNFDLASFEKASYFGQSRFNRDIYFDATEFSENAYFGWSKVDGDAYFRISKFHKGASFNKSEFGGKIYFLGSEFYHDCYFNWAKFEKDVDFGSTRFENNAKYWLAQFGGRSNFEGAKLNSANFLEAKFNDDVYFKNSFIADINLLRTKYNRLFLPWRSIGHFDYDETAYLSLIANYRSLGWFEDQNECYYNYRRESLGKGPFDYLEWIFYGFGVKPSYPLLWSILVIIVFGIIYIKSNGIIKLIARDELEKQIAGSNNQNINVKKQYSFGEISLRDPFLFSLSSFTSGLTDFLQPSIEYKVEGILAQLAVIERLLGSSFIALIIAAITRTWMVR